MEDKHALKLHYIIHNDGAGGAYTMFYESEMLAKFMEMCDDEGFGEPTYESITMLSDSPIEHDVNDISSIEDCLEELDDRMKYNRNPELEREYAILMNMKRKRDVK